jgi:hypothetical protein
MKVVAFESGHLSCGKGDPSFFLGLFLGKVTLKITKLRMVGFYR